MINLPEGWQIQSHELVSKAHGDLGYELDYSLCYAESTDFTMQIPENVKRIAKAGYVWLNKLTGYRLQKGMDGKWRVIDRPKKQKDRIYTQKSNQQPEQEQAPTQAPEQEQKLDVPEAPVPDKEQIPEQKPDYSGIANQIRSNRDLGFHINNLLRERNDALEWIDRERGRDRRTPEDIDAYDQRNKKEFEYEIARLAKVYKIDPEQLQGYLNEEIKVHGPKTRLRTSARQFINEMAKQFIGQYDPDFLDDSIPFEDTEEYYRDLIEKNIRKLCEVTGKDPEKEIERIFQKIEERAKKKAQKEIDIRENEKNFQGNFISEAEKKGFEVEYPEGKNQYQDYSLSKKINGNRLDFNIENLAYRPAISFTVNDSFGKVEGLDPKTKNALAIATARAFNILLKTYRNSDMVFTVQPYDGDDNGEYRMNAYKDMGFGDPDENGFMRGRIVNGKMKPLSPGEEYERDEEDEDDEEFAENKKNIINAIYKILFLEDARG